MNLLLFSVIQIPVLVALNCSWDLRTGEENFGGAQPLNPDRWVTSEDYPEGIIRRREKGLVRVKFSISSDGRVTNCHIDTSSGFSILDTIPCKLLKRRARFSMPKDDQGNSISTDAIMTFYFQPDK